MWNFLLDVVNAPVVDNIASGSNQPSNSVTTTIEFNIDKPSLWLGIFIGVVCVLVIFGLKRYIKAVIEEKRKSENEAENPTQIKDEEA